MYLLDTNVISELRKVGDKRADKNVVQWFAQIDGAQTYLSVITLMELEIGVLRLEHRDKSQGALLRLWLSQKVMPEFAQRTFSVDQNVALTCARLQVPDPRSERDALIGATALVHRLTLITRNVNDFEYFGVSIINPWA